MAIGEGDEKARGRPPDEAVTDKELLVGVSGALFAEPGLRGCRIFSRHVDNDTWSRDIPSTGWEGCIEVHVEQGAVYVGGQVPTLGHRRLVGLVAWWSRGCEDVVNALEITGPSNDEDAALAEDVRWLLNRDRAVDARGVTVRAHGRKVRLEGIVPSHADALAAERKAWCVFGVDAVENRLEVRAGMGLPWPSSPR